MRPCASSTSACENAFSKIKAASACQYGIPMVFYVKTNVDKR